MSAEIVKEMHLMVGLPGSGKTYFAESLYNSDTSRNHRETHLYDMDTIMRKIRKRKPEGVINELDIRQDVLFCYMSPTIIVDGLYLTQEAVEFIIDVFAGYGKRVQVEKVIIHRWEPDVEACLWNDRGRRSENSEYTIKNSVVEELDIEKIAKKFKLEVELVEHEVVRKAEYQVFSDENRVPLEDNKWLYSTAWRTGGETRDYNGNTSRMDSEAPCNFDAFDKLLEDICPEITFLQYKKLYNACVTTDERYESDYYSSWYEEFYKCDMEKFYNMLTEMGYGKIEK